MRKLFLVILLIAAAAGAAYFLGAFDRVTEGRVRTALVEAGVPDGLADCMAPRMVDRLSLNQLRKLERLGAQEGEFPTPLSAGEALDRIRRVDDSEAVQVMAAAAGGCVMKSVLDRI